MHFRRYMDNETYIAPGTNYVLTKTWQIDLVDQFKCRHDGLYVFGNHYIKVENNIAHVLDADFYTKTSHGFRRVFEKGFDYVL